MKTETRIFWLAVIIFCGLSFTTCKKKNVPVEPPVSSPAEPSSEGTPPPSVPPSAKPPVKPAPMVPAPPKRQASPGDAAALRLVEGGVRSLNAGDLDSAEQAFEQALRVSPSNGRPHYYLGVIAAKQGNHQRSLGFLSEASLYLQADAFWMSQIFLQEGMVYKSMNQKETARQKFIEAIRKDPTNQWAKKELDSLK